MNPKKPMSRGPRLAPKSTNKPSKHYWHRRCYPWYDWDDYDWDDYDYDYDYNWDWNYVMAKKMRANDMPGPAQDSVTVAYQQGFKDGWAAAIEYLYVGEEKSMPEPPFPPGPVSPTETLTE